MSSMWAQKVVEPQANSPGAPAYTGWVASAHDVSPPKQPITGLNTPPDSTSSKPSSQQGSIELTTVPLAPVPSDITSSSTSQEKDVTALKRGLLWTAHPGNTVTEHRDDGEDVFGKVRGLGAIGDGRGMPKMTLNADAGGYFLGMSPPSSPEAHTTRPRSNTLSGFLPSDMAPIPSGYPYASVDPQTSQHLQGSYQNASMPQAQEYDNTLACLQPALDALSLGLPASTVTMSHQPNHPPFFNPHSRSQSNPHMHTDWQQPSYGSAPRPRQSSGHQYPTPIQTNFGNTRAPVLDSPTGLPPPVVSAAEAWSQLPNTNSIIPTHVGPAVHAQVNDPRFHQTSSSARVGESAHVAQTKHDRWTAFTNEPRQQTMSPTSPIGTPLSTVPSMTPAMIPSHGLTGAYASRHPSPTDSFANGRMYEVRGGSPQRMHPSPHTPPPLGRHRTPSRNLNQQHSVPSQSQGINYLSYLQEATSPPYAYFCDRIVRVNDQQASIFIQQKLKAVDNPIERSKIVDAIVEKGLDLMINRFGNWAVQRCLEDPCTPEDRLKVVNVMRGHVVELATSPYGTHVVQKALDGDQQCKSLIVQELLMDDPGETLINKHASHVWSKIMELQWEGTPPPIFEYVNQALRGKWAQLACHETGSLVAQHVFENLSEELKRPCVDEVLDNLVMCAKNQWGSWVVQHIIEHGSPHAKARAISILTQELHALGTDQQGVKALDKALKQGDPAVVDGFVRRMAEPRATGKRSIIVDMALTLPGSQFITQVLNVASKEQRSLLYDALRSHVVTLKGSRTGAKVIWMFEKARSYNS